MTLNDNIDTNFTEMKDVIHIYSRKKLECVTHIDINTFKSLHIEKKNWMNTYVTLEMEIKNLGECKENLENMNDYLKNIVLSKGYHGLEA